MKAVYTPGRSWLSSAPLINKEKDYLSLSGNNWDDYSYKTTLNAALYINGEISLNFQLKILIENISYTASHLNKLCKEGWDGIFPIPGENYISVVSDIDFYKIVHSRSKDNITKSFLSDIRDAGYVINILNDHKAIELSQTEGFDNSLLRESGANKSYQDGWRILDGGEQEIHNFKLNLLTKNREVRTISLNFESELLPYDINVLIGPNGIGKSFSLKSLVEYWLQIGSGDLKILEKIKHVPFDVRPNIRRLILVSYSPFEDFILALSKKDNLIDTDAYKYFGFRKERKTKRSV
ncbi:phage protein [Erwinia amylovora MR1]|nr:phage protein [Erwinia amylovora MR1]